ncbi:sce7726 family protein [Vibrio vulnificus]|uniref:sce7726 family protein n=1 Tax=Vibrio vulnificus TaxID=672 RepID=UPI0019D4DEF4|nr:sce7726 family protein [Vibrio vulnificus]MBN8084008.1 sce7726 family protein [Vibrio vulnificus]MBN8126750.1 sce7726 family protein [Vibrio vulnificus]MBN8154235.1 sce7726 family protein [Vibrio vulnificus]HAS6071647.1 sce7726 family protein [Vibrio vulnificus]HDZ3699835.1 sce7726 family protein [Vibrio vulnificus]
MNYKKLAKVFTSSNVTKVAQGDLSLVLEAAKDFPSLSHKQTLSEFFEEAYKLLCKHYPNEYVVKNIIANNVLLGKHSMNTASMLSELRIGSNKADCVVINGSSTCYEIKTKFDTLKRLPEQLIAYTSAFDRTYVVTHETHLSALLEIHKNMPCFGILISNKRNQLSPKVEAPLNKNFDTDLMFHTLRKEEYVDIVKTVNGTEPECTQTELFSQCKDVFCSLDASEANKHFKRVLKAYRRNDHRFINTLPKSMKNLGISYNVHKKNKDKIISSLLDCNQFNIERYDVFSIHERKAV